MPALVTPFPFLYTQGVPTPRPSTARWLEFPPGLPYPEGATGRVPLALVLDPGGGRTTRYRVSLAAAWPYGFDASETALALFETPGPSTCCYFVPASGPGGASKEQRRLLDGYLG